MSATAPPAMWKASMRAYTFLPSVGLDLVYYPVSTPWICLEETLLCAQVAWRAAVAELTIGAGFARALFDLAVARGASPAALTERTGVDRARLGDQDSRIAFDAYVLLMRPAKALT